MGMAGDYYSLEGAGIVFWIPAAMKPMNLEDLGEALEDSDVLAAFQTDDKNFGLIITLYDMECEDIVDFAERVLQLEDAEEGDFYLINDLGAYVFVYDEVQYVSFCAEDGSIFSFQFFPAEDYVFSAIARIIAASIQIIEEE